ncbi:MAG: hypothetical protein HUK21_00195 [Fibrobacteraceae bacterium]|nr:hypothetical protein [Fibrobacteraceae bacterium]
MKSKIYILSVLVFFSALLAQEEPVIAGETAMPNREAAEIDSAEDAKTVENVKSVENADKVTEPPAVEVKPAVEHVDSAKEVAAIVDSLQADSIQTAISPDSSKHASSKSGGLMGSLYPVNKDEAIAHGNIFLGASLFLLQGRTEDDELNVIFGDIYEGEGYTFTVEAFGAYFIKDAVAVGARGGYSRTWFDIDFSILEDLADIKQHRKYVSNGFFVQPFLKNYLKVLDSRNVYFFNETSLLVKYSYGISQSDDGEEIDKTRNWSWTFEFGLNPGLCIMVLDRVAFETSVGLLGASVSTMEIESNGEKRSELVYSMVNFTINLLALDFSLVYFF